VRILLALTSALRPTLAGKPFEWRRNRNMTSFSFLFPGKMPLASLQRIAGNVNRLISYRYSHSFSWRIELEFVDDRLPLMLTVSW